MRVAIVADEFYPAIGGAPTSAMEISIGLSKLGAEPVVLTHAYPGKPLEEEINGVRVIRLNGFVINRINRGVSSRIFRDLYYSIKYGGFDIVHGQDVYSPMSLASVYFARRCGIPSVVTCRSVHKSSWMWRLIYQPLVFTLRRADRTITVSEASAKFCRALGVPDEKIAVILNGIDLSIFNSRVDGTSLREELGIGGSPLVATAIRLVKRKGPGHLVAAFAKVLEALPDAKLVMAGWGPEEENLRVQIKKLGMDGSAFMIGPLSREKVSELMAAADVFILPSTVEAFGRAAVEAMAVGTPVVCPRAGGMPEIIEDGFNGLLFQPGDTSDMADCMLRILTDKRLARRLSKNGMKRACRFSLEATSKRTLELYKEVCEGYG